ncbi:MAG TPA: D-tyrosyl-tRNA(Tyr) deacylase [Firmicutes bacterium]|nr:D-tyrosyl-tRNA(Tyr) deacylase [Bacillota bacterium]
MRAVLQRVTAARVTVGEEETGSIGQGLLILLGVHADDTEADLQYLVEKCANLRIFPDTAGKLNLSLLDIGGSALVVSQFTLYADTRRGRRPGFTGAAGPKQAEQLYEEFCARLRALKIPVATGRFGAYMAVSLVNDGPVTIILDSADRKQS